MDPTTVAAADTLMNALFREQDERKKKGEHQIKGLDHPYGRLLLEIRRIGNLRKALMGLTESTP